MPDGAVRIGCSGWSYAHWRGLLYPKAGSTSDWLERYAQVFDTVEVNATFYRLPECTTVARWAERSPPEFLFAVKASRYLTHVRRLGDVADGIALLDERLEPLRRSGKLGPVLWQLPATFRRDDERLAGLLASLSPGRHAIEFRDASWLHEDVYALLRGHGVALVVADRGPGAPPPWIDTAGWWYVRFHFGRAGDGRYSWEELRAWANRLARAPGDVYAYFNNDWKGYAIRNAETLRELLAVESRARRREAA